MNKLLIAGLGAALLTLVGCATTAPTAAANAPVPWEADESALPAIAPFAAADVPWSAEESALPAVAPVEAFADYDMLPN